MSDTRTLVVIEVDWKPGDLCLQGRVVYSSAPIDDCHIHVARVQTDDSSPAWNQQ